MAPTWLFGGYRLPVTRGLMGSVSETDAVELDPKYRIFGEPRKSIEICTELELVLVLDELRFQIEYFVQGAFWCIARSSCKRIYENEFTDHGDRSLLLNRT